MSLFPAYAVSDNGDRKDDSLQSSSNDCATTHNDLSTAAEDSWLQNASFAVEVSQIPLPAVVAPERGGPDVRAEAQRSGKVPKKRRDKDRSKRKGTEASDTGQVFWEDRKRERANLSVPTLFRPAVPLFERVVRRVLGRVPGKRPPGKVRRRDRYHVRAQRLGKDSSRPQEEADNSSRTAEFNRAVADDPQDVSSWLAYARFQEEACRGGARVTAERQLAILDRALVLNPGSAALLRERVQVADQVLPADTLQQQLAALLDKQPTNLAAWQAYVECSQGTLASCSASRVLALYGEAMEKLHQSRRGVPAAQARDIQGNIVDLLLRCCVFLRQSGLQEKLWALLSMCLELNLGMRGLPRPAPPEEQLLAAEDAVLGSGLPLPALWVRLERLREGAHWLSCEGDGVDPQRLVFPDDVSDLVHPVSGSGLRLVAATLLCLKVPLLPGRHTALRSLGPAGVPWWLDCPEPLLAALEPLGPAGPGDRDLPQDVAGLVGGPQYLCPAPGQEEYLGFVVHTFHACAEALEEPARSAVHVWWLRFERLLVALDGRGGIALPPQRRRRLRAAVKDFLKQEGNRNNLLYYREYALIQHELGHHESALQVLRTAIGARGGLPVAGVPCRRERAGLCLLHRTLCELALRRGLGAGADCEAGRRAAVQHTNVWWSNHYEAASLKTRPRTQGAELSGQVLVALALGAEGGEGGEGDADRAEDRMRHVSTELLLEPEEEEGGESGDGTEHLLPDLRCEWLRCHAWLLLLLRGVAPALAALQDATARQPPGSWRAEALCEARVALLLYDCAVSGRAYCRLWPELSGAVSQFPDNLRLLAALAAAEGSSGGGRVGSPWWRLARSLSQRDAVLPQLFHLLLAGRKQARVEAAALEARRLLRQAGPELPDRSADNRLAALFSRLQRHRAARGCPLLWRLFLRFVARRGEPEACRNAFYQAVERCPWVKALYVEGLALLPAELGQVQDLLVEKELRLHILPEEVDILRKDSVTT
ncbi:nuclear exosome regulator NRDE2 [Bacillus rossius redtenbacheri]|uniref:nuclear exosome regulator NRDE2 n=1 Tax=Bacillus rossius redtenbacheri TaxID=93214 RepID=UPI002FDE008D